MNEFECGVTEYVLLGKGYLMGIGGVDTTIYCTNVPVMVDDIDVEQSIFDLRHTVDKESVDFTLRFKSVTEFTFTEGYQEP